MQDIGWSGYFRKLTIYGNIPGNEYMFRDNNGVSIVSFEQVNICWDTGCRFS